MKGYISEYRSKLMLRWDGHDNSESSNLLAGDHSNSAHANRYVVDGCFTMAVD